MIFDDAIEVALATKDKTIKSIVKLGKVTSVSGGRAYVQHYGDNAASTKQYTYIDGYFPEVNDIVAMIPQGNTWIILGKVCDDTPVEKYAKIDYVDNTFATKTYVDDTFLLKSFANKLEDGTRSLMLSGANLLPGATNDINVGSSSVQFLTVYSKEFYENGVRLRSDGIVVKSGGNTYTLLASVSSGVVTLTPSANDIWSLGTKTYHLKEAWLGLFRGTWKSGQSTERQISWNSSNAIIPDTDNSVSLGASSTAFKELFLKTLIGAVWKYNSSAANTLGWNDASNILPSSTNAVSLGSSTKQLNKFYAKEIYLNGTAISAGSQTVDALTATYGSTNYTLTLSVKNAGASTQYEELKPSVADKFDLGTSSAKLRNIYAGTFYGAFGDGTRSLSYNSSHVLVPDSTGNLSIGNYSTKLKEIFANYHVGALRHYVSASSYRSIEWDSSYNFYPDSTNAVSLGTSSKQFKNIYGQNIYVNGTAVSSDKRLKENIKELDEKHLTFFKSLRPVQYKFKDGDSGRTHTGFLAQEVEDAIHKAGMTNKDMAVVVKDPEDNYYLRYEEIIAVQTKVIQDLMARVASLEARVTKLEAGKESNQ